jgi:hypothetical protein
LTNQPPISVAEIRSSAIHLEVAVWRAKRGAIQE